jgi:Ran GTPase-activating protein (RanGAP) involved in mRNA processing and transport
LLKKNHTLEVLELGTNQLTNEDMIHIVEGLLENNSVTKIDLNSNLFDKPKSIAKLLEHSTLLKEIDLTFSNISEKGFKDILEAFQRNQHSSLTVFNVYFPPLACLNDFQLLCQDNASRLESTCRPT